MTRTRKPDELKHCAFCSTKLERKRFSSGVLESSLGFRRRRYCGRACAGKALDARPSKSNAWTVTHYHARKLVPPGSCSTCGAPQASDVHHIDGNHTNNLLANLQRLCRSCHMKHHHKKASCTLCGLPVKGHGFCSRHYQRWKKYSDPRVTKCNQHRPCVSED